MCVYFDLEKKARELYGLSYVVFLPINQSVNVRNLQRIIVEYLKYFETFSIIAYFPRQNRIWCKFRIIDSK